MMVNIGYTVKFDDIPKTVRDRIESDILREMGLLCALTEGVGHMLEPGADQNIFKSTQHIDDVRQGLALIDAKLQDCYNVLCGYQQELMKLPQQTAAESDGLTTEGLISKIQQAADEINADG